MVRRLERTRWVCNATTLPVEATLMVDRTRSLLFNGVNGSTGKYLFQTMPTDAVLRMAIGQKSGSTWSGAKGDSRDQRRERHERAGLGSATKRWDGQSSRRRTLRGVVEHIDANALEQAGWGVIVPAGTDPAIIEALRPLLNHRKAEAGAIRPGRYQEFTGARAYRPGENATQWLARQGVGPGPVDPDTGVPYYLLIVGGPEAIPFRFQYQLDVQYAVGRLNFGRPHEYRSYAESVIQAETGAARRERRVALAGVANDQDRATQLSTAHLLTPVSASLRADPRFANWTVDTILPSEATTKAGIGRLIGGPLTPPLLFTSSHGIGFDAADPRQLRHQGALLCQDWPGPEVWGSRPIPEEFYFSADDLGANARVGGSIFFHFACYSAGTPLESYFNYDEHFSKRQGIAPQPFLARFPQRLLSHEAGGALAVIGHIDRVWTWSFRWQRVESHTTVFADAMKRLMRGQRVGMAMEKFSERYAEIAANLTDVLDDVRFGAPYDEFDVAELWLASNDARSYVVIGDPAVYLSFQLEPNPRPIFRGAPPKGA